MRDRLPRRAAPASKRNLARAAAPSRCAGAARRCSRCARSPSKAISARRRMPSGANSSVTPSVASSAWYCLVRRRVGLGQDALEVLDRQRVELDADRKAALQLGNQVATACDRWNAPRGDEQDVVGLAPCRTWSSPSCPRPAAAGRAARPGATRRRRCVSWRARDLVDLVDEHDAVLLGVGERLRLELVLVDQLARPPRRSAACSASRDLQLARLACGCRPCWRTCPAAARSSPPCRAAP